MLLWAGTEVLLAGCAVLILVCKPDTWLAEFGRLAAVGLGRCCFERGSDDLRCVGDKGRFADRLGCGLGAFMGCKGLLPPAFMAVGVGGLGFWVVVTTMALVKAVLATSASSSKSPKADICFNSFIFFCSSSLRAAIACLS